MFDKYFVRKHIEGVLKGLRQVDLSKSGVEDLLGWKRTAEGAVQEVYGAGSDLLGRLQKLNVVPYCGLDGSGHLVWTDDAARKKGEDRDAIEQIVLDFQSSVNQSGLPIGYLVPSRRQKISLVFSFISGSVLTLLGVWSASFISASFESFDKKSEAAILLTDFRNWYEANDAEYRLQLAQITSDQAANGAYLSGPAVKQIIDFSESFRRARDNTIDSFNVRLRGFGVNTDTLNVRRRLPIRLDRELKPRLDALQLDQQGIQNLRLDTL